MTEAKPSSGTGQAASPRRRESEPVKARIAPPSAAAPAAPEEAGEVGEDDLWDRVRALGRTKAATSAFLEGLRLVSCESGVASVLVCERKQLSFAEGRRGALEELFERASGSPVRIEFVVEGEDSSAERTGTSLSPEARAEAASNPVVSRAMDLFDGRVVDIEREEGP